jgi:hypothetical protein
MANNHKQGGKLSRLRLQVSLNKPVRGRYNPLLVGAGQRRRKRRRKQRVGGLASWRPLNYAA